MTLQTLSRPMYWPDLSRVSAAAAPANDVAMTSAGHYACIVLRAYRAMIITHFGFLPQAATGSPTATLTLETVDATTGLPTGTLWNAAGGGSTVTTGTLTAAAWSLSALTASATFVAGDVFAAKIAMASGTTLTNARLGSYLQPSSTNPYIVNNTGAPAKAVTIAKCMALGESSTSFVPFDGMMPVSAASSTAFNNTNAAKRGVRFQVPFACRVVGMRIFLNTGNGDFNALIMNDAGTDLGSTSIAVDKDQTFANAGGSHDIMFTTAAVLVPGIWYRLAIEPSSATNTVSYTFTLPTADYRSAMPGGLNYTYAALASGSWDDTQTTLVQVMDLIIDQLDDGAGGATVVTMQNTQIIPGARAP